VIAVLRSRPVIAALLIILGRLARAHATLWPGWVVPLPMLVLAAGLFLVAAGAVVAVVLAVRLRPAPGWRLA